ncbi:Protein of unknown function DUF3712 [Ceraceosorus bombacis]|uniref:Uncharacterized protein n=1 Tax=Ceraceosorus bombacis TaxID=401625 RepID=A0A0P1BGI1_9BASI|nr:Protein of unknown function DUF3712 [Ceraceosorus bombacis]
MVSSSAAAQDPQLAGIPDPEPDLDGDEDGDELGDASGQNAKATKAKGLSRVPAVRALVGKLVHNAKLEISSLHVHSLTKTGFSAKGKARLSAIGTGPLPLVKVKVRLPEATSKLYWVENDASGTIGKRASKDKSGSANAGGAGHIYIANAHIQPFRIKPSAAPGTATADLDLTVSFQPGEEEREGAGLAKVIKHILISPMDAKIRLVMHANGAEVKAYGMRFSGLDVEKEVIVGGLGALGGLLRYGAPILENGRASGDIKPVPSTLGVPNGRSESASSSDQHTGSGDPVGEGAKAKKRFTWRSSLSKKSSPGLNSPFDSPSRSSSATTAPTRGSSFRSSSKPQAARTTSSASSLGSPALEISDFQIVGGHEQRGIENEAVHACAVAGSTGASDTPWLAQALAGARIDAIVPPLGEKARLLDGAELRVEGAGSSASSVRQRTASHVSNLDSPNLGLKAPPSPHSPYFESSQDSAFGGQSALGRRKSAASLAGGSSVARATLRNGFGVEIAVSSLSVLAVPAAAGGAGLEALQLGEIKTSKKWEGLVLPPGGSPVNASLPFQINRDPHSLPIALSHTTSAALLPDVGAPFVKTLVDRAEVKLNGIDVHDMDEDGIMLSTGLRLTNFGPLAASIVFNGPAELFTVAGEQNGASGGLKPGQSKNRVARLHILDRVDVNPKLLQSVKTNARISHPGGAGGTEAFASFVRAFLLESSTEFELVAKVLVTAGGIDFQATLQKRIVLQGLGGFQGLRVENFSVLGEAFAPAVGGSLTHAAAPTENTRTGRGALQVCASVVLPNPSDISLTLSRLELALTYQGAGIGQLAIEDIIMEAYAETQLEARGLVYIESANYEESLQKLGEMINALLLGKEVKLGIQGERAWVQPSKQSGSSGSIVSLAAPAARPRAGTTSEPSRIPWLDAALRGFKAEASVQQPPLKIVDQVSVGHIDASFPQGGSPVISTTNIAVKYSVPGYPIGVKVLSASADVELVFNGVVVGRAKTADGTISEAKESNSDEGASGSFKLTLESFELHTKDEATMSELVFHMFEAGPEGTKRISLRGCASIRAYTCIGELPLTVELGQEHLISIAGFNGLQSSPVQYSGFEIKDACAEYLEVRFNLFLNNPSQVHLRLPDSGLSMGVYFRDTYVGRALVSETSFDLPTGPVAVQNVEFRYAPSEEGPVRAIPSNILSGKQSVLQVKGDRQSVQIPVLVPAIERIRLEFALKPVLNELLESISVHITPTVLTHSTIETAYIIKNPLGVSIDLLSLSFAAHFKSKPFGSASRDMSKAPLRIAPGISRNPGKQQGKIDCRLAQSLDKIVKTFLQERGTLVLDVEVEARVSLNGFVIPTFEYSQRLPLHVDGLGGVSRILGMIG